MNLANLDAAETAFFRRELELIKSRTYDIKYKDLVYRDIFPVDNEGGPGVTSITTQIFDKVGTAAIIGAYANDLPRADISAREVTCPVRTIGSSFGYSRAEVAAAQQGNRSLQQQKANAARRAIEETLNDIAFGRDIEAQRAGLLGFFNNPNIPKSNVVNGAAGTPAWTTKTPDEILFDINDGFATVRETTLNRELVDMVLLPIRQYNFITHTPRSSTSDTTIAMYVVMNSEYISSLDSIIPLVELNGTGTGGADQMIFYNRDPEKLVFDLPHDIEFLDIQIHGLEFMTPAWARSGGLTVYYPLSVLIREGI